MAETLDAAAKKKIHKALLTRAKKELGITEDRAEAENDAAEVVTEDTTSIDDGYQAETAADMSELLDDAAQKRADDIEDLKQLDVSPTDTIRPGAIVEVGGMRYLVGIVAEDLDVDGHTYAGLSTDSPLFAAIDGKSVGDEVTVNDKVQKITLVA